MSTIEDTEIKLRKSRVGRVYLAGPMTGYADYNFPAFNAAAERMRKEGFDVVNPADHGVVDGADWADYLRYDIAKLADCEFIAVLPGWSKSKGAQLEFHIAQSLGMVVRYLDDAERSESAFRTALAGSASAGASEAVALPGNMGYEPDGPVKMALQWLHVALECKSFHWDGDQHEAATRSMEDAHAWINEVRALGVIGGAGGVPAGWQPIETAPKGKTILVGFPNSHGNWRTVKATYYLPNTLELSEDDPNYNDDDDGGYAPEGWYEESYTHENILRLEESPTHWMLLPKRPDASPRVQALHVGGEPK